MIDKLVFRKAGPDGASASPDEERLMQLFQNRAGLKKAYADLQDELHLLRDRLKQQEGATIRLQEQLDAIGDLLADPGTGFGALVFYQLRGLWKTCHHNLSAFAADLTRTQEARETARHKAECDAIRVTRLAEIERRLDVAAGKADLQREHLATVQLELSGLTAFWHYFERRRRSKSLEALRQALVLADAAVGELHAERSAISAAANGDFPGISLAARRNINLALIAYAELLCETVDGFGLAPKAREAVARRVHEMTFGGRGECEDYMQRIQKAQAAVADQKQITAPVKTKMERLRMICEYRNGTDTVPTADSLIPPAPPPDALARLARVQLPKVWNVLAEDYWDLNALLMR